MIDSYRTIKTRLKLRRDTESAYLKLQNFVPLKGEILLVDTDPNDPTQLRSKIGDGNKTFSQLPYSDQFIRDSVSGIVVHGYYYNGQFYTDEDHKINIVPYSYKIYIDIVSKNIYGYFDEDHAYSQLGEIATATSQTPGVMKLYSDTGNHTDGTMTQASITAELGKKTEVSIGDDEELILEYIF